MLSICGRELTKDLLQGLVVDVVPTPLRVCGRMGHDLHTCKCVRQMGASNMGDANVPPFRTSCSVRDCAECRAEGPVGRDTDTPAPEQIEVVSDRIEPSALKRRLIGDLKKSSRGNSLTGIRKGKANWMELVLITAPTEHDGARQDLRPPHARLRVRRRGRCQIASWGRSWASGIRVSGFWVHCTCNND